jgi:5'-nucleotidase
MRVLITNDDGIHAAGLKVLTRVARECFDEVVVVAPTQERSGVGQAISLHRPLRVEPAGENAWAVSGTPVDCVLVALDHLMADRLPDLVLSGINHGANIGWDIYYSGTVGAAREAAIQGIPAVALSLVGPRPFDFDALAEGPLRPLIERLAAAPHAPETLLNVNFPNPTPKGTKATRLGHRSYANDIIERADPRGKPYYWIGGMLPEVVAAPGTDGEAIKLGFTSVTPLGLDVTHHASRETLAKHLADPKRTP